MSTKPVIKRLDHLGLIAAFCHEIGLLRMIDAVIPKYSDHNVSHGDAVLRDPLINHPAHNHIGEVAV
ncbi:DUF4277 domain-containing protein [Vibrio navarrensis]|uniref:DUF4277 domain-containing protein n=1 Tax=Vibrio navarrensis TaxID=29495 RepID=A0AAJ4IA34_9VIBR|nr:DUF4277 domain-containing protein [Vibrio navarrensis]